MSPHGSGRCATFLSSLSDFVGILDDAHTQIMSSFFDHIRVTHAEHLCDLNTCKSSITDALQRWTTAVQECTTALGSNPGAATHNVAVDTVRMHSRRVCGLPCKLTETAYLVSKGAHDARVQDHEATITAKLTTGILEAVQAYLEGCVSTLLKYMWVSGDSARPLACLGIFLGYGVPVPNTDANCRVCPSPDGASVSCCDAAAGNVHCDRSHASPNLPALLHHKYSFLLSPVVSSVGGRRPRHRHLVG